MVQRFLLYGIDRQSAGEAVGGRDQLAAFALPYRTDTALPVGQSAVPGAEIAFDTSIIAAMPVSCRFHCNSLALFNPVAMHYYGGMNGKIRMPAVAGMFYPEGITELRAAVEGYLAEAGDGGAPSPKAVIVPHAGYIYSGPVAASAYARIEGGSIRRVVLMGPSHRVYLSGTASSSASAWHTPLGDVPVEAPSGIPIFDEAHAQEHSLEVQLPFLQVILHEFTLMPLVVGDATKKEVAAILESLWGGKETLVVISSDLSHYESYDIARQMDAAASDAITGLNPSGLHTENACGRIPIRGLLQVAEQRGMQAELLDLRNSGDTAGSRDQVVGYGAYAFYE